MITLTLPSSAVQKTWSYFEYQILLSSSMSYIVFSYKADKMENANHAPSTKENIGILQICSPGAADIDFDKFVQTQSPSHLHCPNQVTRTSDFCPSCVQTKL